MNFVKAFSDYITNFVFGKGIQFRVPDAYAAIIPGVLERVWRTDNEQDKTLWEIGQMGSVSGDVFIKVAYEPAWQDSVGNWHPGRCRIIPLNPAMCFPEFHPHDRNRLIRFKLKYRFWGTSLEGTRQVFTYTELITDTEIEEYVNDELIDRRPNPLGEIPVVHITNMPVASSPWGLADINDIVPLNREYNEKATDISDIINYHAAPVTIITGAKASQLEKGPKKVWAGLPKDSKVFNLELGAGLEGPLAYLALLKTTMHELTGVPEMALGQMIPISNTSGVALSIQFQPLMNRWGMKKIQYGSGLEKVNELVLKTLSIWEPEVFVYDVTVQPPLRDGQFDVIDFADPVWCKTSIHFPPPLPLDVLVKLNELQAKIMLGLESQRGALVELGEEFPDEKLEDLFKQKVRDKQEAGALQMLEAKIMAAIVAGTGLVPPMPGATGAQAQYSPVPAQPGADGTMPATGPMPGTQIALDPETQDMLNQMVTLAFGTKIPQRSAPDNK